MPTSEPAATALLLTTCGILLAGERALQPGLAADRRPDRAVLPRGRHAGRIRGDRRDPVRRLPARLPHGLGGAGAHPLRRRAQHPDGRGAPRLGSRGRARRRSACCSSPGLVAVPAHLWADSPGPRRCCSARSSRPPTRPRPSPCSGPAGSSSSGGWARRSRSSPASTIRSPSSSPPRSTSNLLRPGAARPGRDARSRSSTQLVIGAVVGIGAGYAGRRAHRPGSSW